MSLLNRILRTMKPDLDAVRKERLATCKKCKFYNETWGSCGTVIKGDDVQYRNKDYHLCGCIMAVKTGLPWASCSVGKWKALNDWGQEHYDLVLNAVEQYETQPTKATLVGMYRVYKELCKCDFNVHSNCGSCKTEVLKELRHYLKKYSRC